MRIRLLAISLGLLVALGALTSQALSQPNADKVTIKVLVPADARVVVGSTQTTLNGKERYFVSPLLEIGPTYYYMVKATWMKDGKPVEQTRKVFVTPGKETTVDFFAAAPVEPPPATVEPGKHKAREFLFTYEATVSKLKPGAVAKIWLPVATSSEYQSVKIATMSLPGKETIGTEPRYGNSILHVEGKADDSGTVKAAVTYRVKREEVKGDSKSPPSKDELEQFLKADKLVPVGGKSLALIIDKTLPKDSLQLGKALYDVVDQHMKYSKEGTGWGKGDSDWACDSKYGNCTDFHSMFISLARAKKLPAKFEMGFPIPDEHGSGDVKGYHCWAWFHPAGKGWVAVDISEMSQRKAKDPSKKDYYFGNLTENRVSFTTGRDIDLVPKQAGPALNFFIYPYVEVEGKTYDAANVQRKFSYQDVK